MNAESFPRSVLENSSFEASAYTLERVQTAVTCMYLEQQPITFVMFIQFSSDLASSESASFALSVAPGCRHFGEPPEAIGSSNVHFQLHWSNGFKECVIMY